MKIRAIRAITVDIPLDRPIVMGPIRFDSREYLVVEVSTVMASKSNGCI